MVFDHFQHLDLREMLQPGQCTVLQLNEIDERDQQVIVATLLRRINNARMDTEKRQGPARRRALPALSRLHPDRGGASLRAA